jgi:hypothetical protein
VTTSFDWPDAIFKAPLVPMFICHCGKIFVKMPDIASPANFLVTVSDYWGHLVACDTWQFLAVRRDGIFSSAG